MGAYSRWAFIRGWALKQINTVNIKITLRAVSQPQTFNLLLSRVITSFITYMAKLLNADWLRQRVFFLNHKGTLREHYFLMLIA